MLLVKTGFIQLKNSCFFVFFVFVFVFCFSLNAQYSNNRGSYKCTYICKVGYSGNGNTCKGL